MGSHQNLLPQAVGSRDASRYKIGGPSSKPKCRVIADEATSVTLRGEPCPFAPGRPSPSSALPGPVHLHGGNGGVQPRQSCQRWKVTPVIFLPRTQLSKAAPALGDGERKPNEVIKFLEVYERSFCRTIETLVDIFQEYPDEVEYIFKPSCVPLMRCAGCCGDEGLECVPVDVYNVTMEIMRIKPHQSQHIAHMSFLQHSKCDCRPKKDVKNKQEKKSKRGKGKGQKRKRKKGRYKPLSFHCEPCSERRKHLFVQDPQTCKCSCKFTDSRCKSRQLELNERTCRCEKPRR
ncbi:PREDICTED: vascular endothelial growth factor A [Calidris pugnax]|uniref:vascular endothelial growth factor A n=1 Tax=Calidris pugnax TaxID=198806 RepID=UPI00071C833E|nr:PREDICTED: vascular endothelial growth factor A [Calidris pugnax]